MNNRDIELKAIEYANKTATNDAEYWSIIEQGLMWGVDIETGKPNTVDTPRKEYTSVLDQAIVMKPELYKELKKVLPEIFNKQNKS